MQARCFYPVVASPCAALPRLLPLRPDPGRQSPSRRAVQSTLSPNVELDLTIASKSFLKECSVGTASSNSRNTRPWFISELSSDAQQFAISPAVTLGPSLCWNSQRAIEFSKNRRRDHAPAVVRLKRLGEFGLRI